VIARNTDFQHSVDGYAYDAEWQQEEPDEWVGDSAPAEPAASRATKRMHQRRNVNMGRPPFFS
jgi:hypothetical protein